MGWVHHLEYLIFIDIPYSHCSHWMHHVVSFHRLSSHSNHCLGSHHWYISQRKVRPLAGIHPFVSPVSSCCGLQEQFLRWNVVIFLSCWFGYHFTPYYYILDGPRAAIIAVSWMRRSGDQSVAKHKTEVTAVITNLNAFVIFCINIMTLPRLPLN